MTGRHVIYDEAAAFSLGAGDSTAADGQLAGDFLALTLTRARWFRGPAWASLGAREGVTGKVAKRDAKRLAARTRRAWYLHRNQETQTER